MDKHEVINALTMLPGFYYAYQFYAIHPGSVYRLLSYVLVCIGSIIHHMWKSVGGDDRYTFRIDLTCQQIFAYVCINQHYPDYVVKARHLIILLTCVSLRLSTLYDVFILLFINILMCALCVGDNADARYKMIILLTLFACSKSHIHMRAVFHPLFHFYCHVFILSVMR